MFRADAVFDEEENSLLKGCFYGYGKFCRDETNRPWPPLPGDSPILAYQVMESRVVVGESLPFSVNRSYRGQSAIKGVANYKTGR